MTGTPFTSPNARHERVTPPPATPAVLLVDDHDLFRAGLRTLLEGQSVRVVGDSRCEASAIDMARRTRANVVLVDTATVDGATTAPLLEQFSEQLPDVSLIMFTRSNSPADIYASVRAGARAYIDKGAPIEQLVSAVRSVAAGHAWVPPQIAGVLLDFLRTGVVPMTSRTEMSEREVDVLRLIAEGLDNNEIAARLGISGKTVKNHVSSILMKLELTNRVQAAVFAVKSGIA